MCADFFWLGDSWRGEAIKQMLHEWLSTWWFIPLSKWVITLVISGLTPLIPFITRVIIHLLSGMSRQVGFSRPDYTLFQYVQSSFSWHCCITGSGSHVSGLVCVICTHPTIANLLFDMNWFEIQSVLLPETMHWGRTEKIQAFGPRSSTKHRPW